MKIEIFFEDNPDGSVAVKCTPGADTLRDKWRRKESMSPAEVMAMISIAAAVNSSKNAEIMDQMRGKSLIVC